MKVITARLTMYDLFIKKKKNYVDNVVCWSLVCFTKSPHSYTFFFQPFLSAFVDQRPIFFLFNWYSWIKALSYYTEICKCVYLLIFFYMLVLWAWFMAFTPIQLRETWGQLFCRNYLIMAYQEFQNTSQAMHDL